MYIVFEGIDGSGKSTLIQKVKKYLSEKYKVFTIHEPYFIKKDIIFHEHSTKISELLTFISDRLMVYNYLSKIEKEYNIILSDRSWLSTYVYQIMTLNTQYDHLLNKINEFENSIKKIDVLFLLDVDPKKALERISSRNQTEKYEKLEFLKKIQNNYFEILNIQSLVDNIRNIFIINSNYKINTVFKKVKECLKEVDLWVKSQN